MDQQLTRSALLRGLWRRDVSPLRPPWALAEGGFVAACPPNCGLCIDACPEDILSLARDDRPQIQFGRGECTFCAECVEACPTGALARAGDAAPWSLVARVAETCLSIAGVTCRSCGDACGEDAIRFSLGLNGVARPLIDGETCTGCGACMRPCPVDAITISRSAPAGCEQRSGPADGFGRTVWLRARIRGAPPSRGGSSWARAPRRPARSAFLLDIFVGRRAWCGHLCPVGAFYGLIGRVSLLRVNATNRSACTDCMDCYAVCPESHVITPALRGAPQGATPVIRSGDCTNCGRCIDVCPVDVFAFGTRFRKAPSGEAAAKGPAGPNHHANANPSASAPIEELAS